MQSKYSAYCSLLLLFCISLIAHADFSTGQQAYKKGDCAVALKEFEPLAQQGQAPAQYMLGRLYSQGCGVKKDDAEFVRWDEKAAQQGLPSAQFDLAFSYENGTVVGQNNTKALKWYTKAANAGLPMAQGKLASCYGYGDLGVTPDPKAARHWLQLAAEGGDHGAITNLAVEYINGNFGPIDFYKAYFWATLGYAANSHNDHARIALESAGKKLTSSEIARAQGEAKKWKPRGNIEGTFIFSGIH